MKKTLLYVLCLFFLSSLAAQAKTYDLVLVHGLTNKHKWSNEFVNACLATWGSGNVYIVYNNSSTTVWERWINGRKAICIGTDDYTAGDDYIWTQASYMRTKILKLQASYGLSAKFNVIGHSMGGLVTRYYTYAYPYTVAGLVTLGTPHQGSELAYVADFLLDWFIGAEDAMEHLKPSFVRNQFNVWYPVSGMPFADGGKLYTIRGDGDGWDCWGAMGELQAGWDVLFTVYWTDNDGLVPKNASLLSGATHVADYSSYDHQELVQKADVANKAASYLR